MWAVLAVLWIGFYHAGFISLCLDLFVLSICILCFCFLLHICYSTVSTVGWTVLLPLSANPLVYLKNQYIHSSPNFHRTLYTVCDRGWVLLWRWCNMSCTYGVVDEVTFAHVLKIIQQETPVDSIQPWIWCKRLARGHHLVLGRSLLSTIALLRHASCSFVASSGSTSEQGLTSHQTHYRSYQGRILRVKWSNQQCQSTEGSLVLRIRLQSHQVHPTVFTVL